MMNVVIVQKEVQLSLCLVIQPDLGCDRLHSILYICYTTLFEHIGSSPMHTRSGNNSFKRSTPINAHKRLGAPPLALTPLTRYLAPVVGETVTQPLRSADNTPSKGLKGHTHCVETKY